MEPLRICDGSMEMILMFIICERNRCFSSSQSDYRAIDPLWEDDSMLTVITFCRCCNDKKDYMWIHVCKAFQGSPDLLVILNFI